MRKYKIDDIVTLSEVNKIKNRLYKEAFNSISYDEDHSWWSRKKREILKRVKFKIVEL